MDLKCFIRRFTGGYWTGYWELGNGVEWGIPMGFARATWNRKALKVNI